MSTELSVCPECSAEWPDYHTIEEDGVPGLLCDQCGYWSADPERYCPPGCVGHEGPAKTRDRMTHQ